VQSDALGTFPYMVVLGFGIVWMTLATLGFVWFATWRSTRREAAASAVHAPASPGRGMTRGRVLGLVGVGLLGGAVLGGAASAYASYLSARNAPPRGGGTTQPAP
jgi:hypothetical protein